VGAFLGARFGAENIVASTIDQDEAHLERVNKVIERVIEFLN
jgi:hypothetical protein